jgi:hypothetical protein
MMDVIAVEAVDGGWALRHGSVDNAQLFTSGAKAEDAARRLGARLSDAGELAEIRIYLRDGSLAGRFLCAPEMRVVG